MKQILSLFFSVIFLLVFGQSNDTLSSKQRRKLRPSYIVLGIGLNNSIYRDFATSPLFYKGIIPAFSLGKKKIDAKRESFFLINYASGKHKYNTAINPDKSKLWTLTLEHCKLYQIPKFSTERLNYKIGVDIQFTNNFRINEKLENSAYGYETFLNFSLSQKLTLDVSRKREINKSWKFLHYHRKQKRRELSCQFNFGVLNNNIRNGYIYLGQSDVINNFKIYDGYFMHFMQGIRMSSAINYTIFLKNANAFQFSYFWDALSTGTVDNRFDMSSHKFQFSLLFNLK